MRNRDDQSAAVMTAVIQPDLRNLKWGLRDPEIGLPDSPETVPVDARRADQASSRVSTADRLSSPMAPEDEAAAEAGKTNPELAFAARLVAAGDPTASESGAGSQLLADPPDRSAPPRSAAPAPDMTTAEATPSETALAATGGMVRAETRASDAAREAVPAPPVQPRETDATAQGARTVRRAGTPAGAEAMATRPETGGSAPVPPPPAPHDRVASSAPPPEPSATEPAIREAQQFASRRDVSVRLEDGSRSVDVRLADRAGEIRVTVHTGDRELATSLRGELPDLVSRLRQSGFQAEAWHPAAAPDLADWGRDCGGNFSGFPEQDLSRGRRDDRQQKRPHDQNRWAGEWTASLSPAQERAV